MEIATDDSFKKIITSGKTTATSALGFSVHIEAQGLKPDHWYFYRFQSGNATSPIGRTRTMQPRMPTPKNFVSLSPPANIGSKVSSLLTSKWLKTNPTLVFHLGDYIYEYASGRGGKVRRHLGPEIETLEQYRLRYCQYKTDPDLQAMHASCPWFLTWDDHEVDNNYSNDISEQSGVTPAQLLLRRANAYQAYYEMMPLRSTSLPKGPNMQLYRKGNFGEACQTICP